MTDKEMLELAARAAGIEHGAERTECGISTTLSDGRHGYLPQWNPLTDDGDALRLAVRLRMKIYHAELGAIVEPKRMSFEWVGVSDDDAGDRYAATRRAITRAAAEVGKILESK